MSRSIWQHFGHWATIIATDFAVPGIYDSMFAFCWPRLRIRASDCAGCYSDYYIIMACLFRKEIRWDSLVWFPISFHCTLEGRVQHFWAAMWSEILNFCCLLVFHGLGQTIMQFLLSKMQNTSRRIHISHGAADKLGLQFKFSMHISILLFVVK